MSFVGKSGWGNYHFCGVLCVLPFVPLLWAPIGMQQPHSTVGTGICLCICCPSKCPVKHLMWQTGDLSAIETFSGHILDLSLVH